ncbi:MAG: hypothetical protein DIU68_013830 [Chloroflexota bacterium]|nr:MAG: hypothetical protein DIU68_08305 [Chloroflexota bacterium]
MRHQRDALKTAINLGMVNAALNALVSIAEMFVERGDTERAANILALVLCYPMSQRTGKRARELFSDLEQTVCPRVIADARSRAELLTLDDLASEVLAETANE